MPAVFHLTKPLLWMCITFLLILESFITLLARQLIHHQTFHQLRWFFIILTGIFYLAIWISAIIWAWDWFCVYIFPVRARYWVSPLFATSYTLLAQGMFWLCLKLRGHLAATWVILGGVERLLGYIVAFYGLGTISKPSILQGSVPFLVLIFAIFEKAFYWILILLGCSLLRRVIKRKTGLAAGA